MRKRLLDIFVVFYLMFGWIFLFCGTITTNYFSNVYKLELKNNDVFKDLSYSDLNKYDIQSSLMLRQDYFMQNLAPNNYAFSFGIQTPLYSGASVDKNDSNYWFKKIILSTLKDDFYLTWWNQSQNGNQPDPYNQFYWKPNKGSSVSEAIGFKILFNGIKWSHVKKWGFEKNQKLNKNNKPFTKMVFLFVKPKLLINWFRERIAS